MNLQRIKNVMSMSNSNRGSGSRNRPKANLQDPTECNVFCSDMVGLEFIERKLNEVAKSKQIAKLELEDLLDQGQQHLKILPRLKSLLLNPGRKWESVRFVDTFPLEHFKKWHSTKGSILEDYQYQDTALVGWKKLMEFRASIEISSGTPVEDMLQLFEAVKQDPHVVYMELRLDMLSGKKGSPEEMVDLIHRASTTGSGDESKEGTITRTIFVGIHCGHCETGYTKKQMDLKLLLNKSVFLLKCAGLEVAPAPLTLSDAGTGTETTTSSTTTPTNNNARAVPASVASMRVPRRQPAAVPSMDMSLRGSQSRSTRRLGKSTSFDVLPSSCTQLQYSSSLHVKASLGSSIDNAQWNMNTAVDSIPERRAVGPANRLATSNRKPAGRTKSASLVRPRMTSVNGVPVSVTMSSSDTSPPRQRIASTTSQSQRRTVLPQRKLPSRSRSDLSQLASRSTGIIKKSSSAGNLDLLGADSDDEDGGNMPTESPAMMQRRARRRRLPAASQSAATMKKSSSAGNLDLLGADSDDEDDAPIESAAMMQRRARRRMPPAAFSEVSQPKNNSSDIAAPPRRKLPARSKSDLSELPRNSGAAQKRDLTLLKVRAQKRASSPPLARVPRLNNDGGHRSTDSPTNSNGRKTRTRPATVTPELSPPQRKSETTANPQRKLPLRSRSDLGMRENTTPKRTVSDKSAFEASDDSMAATATTRTSLASVRNRQPEAGIRAKQRQASLSPKRQGSSSPKRQEPSFDISDSNLDLEVLLAAKSRLDAAIAQKQREQGGLPDYDWGEHGISLSRISTTQAFRPTNPNA